jgi:hypothetical protein
MKLTRYLPGLRSAYLPQSGLIWSGLPISVEFLPVVGIEISRSLQIESAALSEHV